LSSCPKNHSCPICEPFLPNKGEEKYGALLLSSFCGCQLLPQDPWTVGNKTVPKYMLLNCTCAAGARQEMSQVSCLWGMCYPVDLQWPLILACQDPHAYIGGFGAPHTKKD